jgi:hypothetical protein
MTLKDAEKGEKQIRALLGKAGPDVIQAIHRLGFVHFARFVFFPSKELRAEGEDLKFAIITTYDFEFKDYMDVFIEVLGPVFDAMLPLMKNSPPIPVRVHRKEFIDYVLAISHVEEIFYSAYPNLTVQNIRALEERHA